MIGLKTGQYKIFTMLRERVIDVAVKEINKKTDLKVGYSLEKQGRKIVAICFKIGSKSSDEAQEKSSSEILAKLKEFGIKTAIAKKLLKEHDEDYILANIKVVEEQLQRGKAIRNIPGYLMRAFQKDFRPTGTKHEKQKKAKTQKKLRRIDKMEQRQKEQRTLRKQFEKERNQEVAAYLKSLDEKGVESLKQEYFRENSANDRLKPLIKSKGFDHPALQSFRYKFIAKTCLAEKWHTLEAYLEISGIEIPNGEISN